jgi:hypothetical protein
MDVREFKGNNHDYRQWIASHPGGFVVNVDDADSSGTRLHRVECSFVQGPIAQDLDVTGTFWKACSTNREGLRGYWSGGKPCAFCKP